MSSDAPPAMVGGIRDMPLEAGRAHGSPAGPWRVAQGYVDVFAVATGGARLHVARIDAGAALLPVTPAREISLVAVGGLEAELVALEDGCTGALLQGWMRTLATAVHGRAIARSPVRLGEARMLIDGEQVEAPAEPAWLLIEQGAIRASEDGIVFAAGRIVPLFQGWPLLAHGPATIRPIDTDALSASGAIDEPLALFHERMLAGLDRKMRAAADAAAERLVRRTIAERKDAAGALGSLAAAIGGRGHARIALSHDDPVKAAIMMACDVLAITDAHIPAHGAAIPVAELARMVGLGCRRILLRDGWWRRENGILLAYREADGAPRLLIPVGRRGYRMADPVGGAQAPVDASDALDFAASAFMLYRPAPRDARSIAALLRFGISGGLRDLATVAVTGLAGALLATFVPIATGLLFEQAIPAASTSMLLAILLAMIVAALGGAAFDFVSALALVRLEAAMEGRLQPALLLRLLALPVGFFRDYAAGDMADRVLAFPRIRRLAANAVLSALLGFVTTIASLGVIFASNMLLGLLALVVAGFATLASLATALGQRHAEREAARLGGRENALLLQLIQGVAKLRIGARTAHGFALWATLFADRKRALMESAQWTRGRNALLLSIPLVAQILFFAATVSLLSRGRSLELGAFFTANAAFAQIFAAILAVATSWTNLVQAVPMFDRLRPILDAAPESQPIGGDIEAFDGSVELAHISFRYKPGAPLVLEDVSLRVEPGQFVALVGPSGSGKSTLLRLLLGFEAATVGEILFRGRPMASQDPASLRRSIGIVLQTSRTMTGNLYDNIVAGRPFSLDDAWEAARLSGLDGDIRAMPMQMHTPVMEGSSTLSGGQVQRLMIARALVAQPKLLLLDEATSALDNRSQAIVTASLKQFGITRIVIAHRLSTIQDADRIFVLRQGRLVEDGGFAELVARGGLFADLTRRQIL